MPATGSAEAFMSLLTLPTAGLRHAWGQTGDKPWIACLDAGVWLCVATRYRGRHTMQAVEFKPDEAGLLGRYFTNLDRPVFALRNLHEVVKGVLFSRYSRTEKSLRRVLLDEFINDPESGFAGIAASHAFGVGTPGDADDMVAVRRAEEFYERVLVGYGDDSVAELAGAH